MPQQIPEQAMWVVLEAIHHTAGNQAAAILTAAGLGRLLTTPPSPTSLRPAATPAELIALYHQVYAMLGEDLTRLFQRNYGAMTVQAILQLPRTERVREEGRRVPRERQVRWFVETMAAQLADAWAPHHVSEDAAACYLEPDICFACYGIQGVQKPLCAAGDVLFSRLAHEYLGRRVRVVEVACAAMGAPHCKYALYK